jgi:hypothetical protein
MTASCCDFLPLDDQWIAGLIHETLVGLAVGPAGQQMDAEAVLAAYQAEGGPQIITREPGNNGRWREFEAATGRRWEHDQVGLYDQAGDRVWLDVSREPQGLRWGARWHELSHSAGAPHRLGRTDFLALQRGVDTRDPAALLKNAHEEITAEFGAVLLGQQTGTFSAGQFAISQDFLIQHAWVSPVALDPAGMQQLLDRSAADATRTAEYVLEPARQADRDAEAGS